MIAVGINSLVIMVVRMRGVNNESINRIFGNTEVL